MRGLLTATLLLVWSATALAGEAAPPVGLQLRGMESAAEGTPEQPAAKRSVANAKRPKPVLKLSLRGAVPPDHKAKQSQAQTSAAAAEPPDASSVDVDDPADVWGGETSVTSAAPRRAPSPNVVQINLLRGHSSEFMGPENTETLHQSSFGDFGGGIYKMPPTDGRVAVHGLAGQAFKPFAQHRKSRALPIADISIAVMALLAFILARSFLASMRRQKARRAKA